MVFQPIVANHVVDELAGKIINYKDLMKRGPESVAAWSKSFSNEIAKVSASTKELTPFSFFTNMKYQQADSQPMPASWSTSNHTKTNENAPGSHGPNNATRPQ